MVDLWVVAVAIVTLFFIVRRGPSIHLLTALVLALLTGAWVGANLRRYPEREDFVGGAVPPELDPITRAMFSRGWPLAPVMICLFHGMRFRPSGLEGITLVIDWLVLVVSLAFARFVCELYPRWQIRRKRGADHSLDGESTQKD